MRTAGIVLLLLAWVHADVATERAAARNRLAGELQRIADWCGKNKLLLDRARTCEMILRLQPDHETARKRLKYKRDKDGAWIRDPRYREPKNRNASAHGEWRKRIDAAGERYADALVAALENNTASDSTRAMMLEEVFLWVPDHEDAHLLAGEVRFQGKWWMQEALTARDRRRELIRLARRVQEETDSPRVGRLTAAEQSWGLAWTAVFTTKTWRLVSTAPIDEARVNARYAGSCNRMFDALFSFRTRRREGQVFYSLMSASEYHRLLRAHPELTAADRKDLWDLSSGWSRKSNTCIDWGPTLLQRRELCVRQPFGSLLHRHFGIRAKHGWAWEGIGLYVAELMTGSKRSTFVWDGPYARDAAAKAKRKALWERIHAPHANWFALARELKRDGKLTALPFLLGKDVNQMLAEDLITAYVLAAFLLEAHEKQVPALLAEIGHNKTKWGRAFPAILGKPLPVFEARMRRWLDNRAD